MTASLCSLKGPRHGGANTKVVQMKAEEWEQQFKSIWDRWSKPIYKYYLHRLNGDAARAEDCTQNTCLTL